MKKIDYKKGDVVGELVFIANTASHESPSRKTRKARFRCKCGNEFTAIIRSAISGNTKSCGCYGVASRKKRFKKHGKRGHPLYSIWCGIKTRCYNKNRDDYKYYGGRGIILSDEFINNFEAWFEYVTSLPRYENREKFLLTIDRINCNGNYERGNIQWATRKEQALNRRVVKKS